MDTWAVDFVDSLAQAVGKTIDMKFEGKNVAVSIDNKMVEFFNSHLEELLNISKDAFKEAIILMSEGKNFSARVKIYEQFSNDILLDKYKAGTIQLSDAVTKAQASKDFWVALCKQIGTKVVFAALGKLL